MATHKLLLEDFEDDNFNLIAIYSAIDDYLLAYKLNTFCDLNLKRAKEDLIYSENEYHSFFDFEDEQKDIYYALLKNKSEISKKKEQDELFNISQVVHILPEYSRADYFLKIEPKNDELSLRIHAKLKEINQIAMSRIIESSDIKNKSNLIF
ncbi:MAG: IPExxxVDY family protein [Flavobacteriaceae bacterium]|nr:IPExxxVDY family protein [Flavobacteriaceae bacterium]